MDAELGLVPVREAHRFDPAALAAWCGRHVEGFRGPLSVAQFEGGQSNPSFLLEAASGRYVLRKQPPGRLLPSAQVAYIDQCGHDPTIEQPDEFSRIVVEFLR